MMIEDDAEVIRNYGLNEHGRWHHPANESWITTAQSATHIAKTAYRGVERPGDSISRWRFKLMGARLPEGSAYLLRIMVCVNYKNESVRYNHH